MNNWYSIIFCILILSLIVIFHEFGHFIVARTNGIAVTEFMVGLGPVLLEKKIKGTRFTLRVIPFGGACIMKGTDMDIDEHGQPPEPEAKEGDIPPADNDTFPSKSVWARIATIFAGPFFNFVLAFILAVIVLGIAGIDKPYIVRTLDGLPAQAAGIQTGDLITELDGRSVKTARDISLFFDDVDMTQPIEIAVLRDGQKKVFSVQPCYSDEYEKYMLGITWSYERHKTGTLETIGYSFYEVWYWIKLTVKSLGMIITRGVSVDDFSGPVGVATYVDETVEASKSDGFGYVILNLLNLCILLSADIGVMNLLPIPALDGGRLVFLFIEAIRGKPIDPKKEGYVHIAGIIFLLLLMVVIMFNDIRKLF